MPNRKPQVVRRFPGETILLVEAALPIRRLIVESQAYLQLEASDDDAVLGLAAYCHEVIESEAYQAGWIQAFCEARKESIAMPDTRREQYVRGYLDGLVAKQ